MYLFTTKERKFSFKLEKFCRINFKVKVVKAISGWIINRLITSPCGETLERYACLLLIFSKVENFDQKIQMTAFLYATFIIFLFFDRSFLSLSPFYYITKRGLENVTSAERREKNLKFYYFTDIIFEKKKEDWSDKLQSYFHASICGRN